MSSIFEIEEHTLECQHIREYPRATANSQEDVLQLAIKQYSPLDNPQPNAGDVTIIGVHANGFPKEMYEPLWEDLHTRSKAGGFRIRSIWIADISNQGDSGILNESLLGDDPSWLDHSRDLLHMINTFRSQMPLPIVGIGHSLGGTMLVNLSLMHPRLLTTLILLDPMIQTRGSAPNTPHPAALSVKRRDLWASHSEAEQAFRKSKFYQSWDPRVLDRWCQYGIRETPTIIHPNEKGKATLKTTRDQECLTFLRASWEGMSPDGSTILNRDAVPDINLAMPFRYPFYRAEPCNTLEKLSEVRPSVLYVCGEKSPMSTPQERKLKMDITGTGVGGSGGAKEGRVEEVVLKGLGHLIVMESSRLCADAAAGWLGRELKRWEEEGRKYVEWTKKSLVEKSTLSEEWKKRIKTVGMPEETSKI